MGFSLDGEDERHAELPPGQKSSDRKPMVVNPNRRRADIRARAAEDAAASTGWQAIAKEIHVPLGSAQVATQGLKDPACVGYAVAAALRAHRYRVDRTHRGALDPIFLYAVARERAWNRDGDEALPTVNDALKAANEYGTPAAGQGPALDKLPCEPGEFSVKPFADAARANRLRSHVDLGIWIQDWYTWLRDTGPVVFQFNVQIEKFLGASKSQGVIAYEYPSETKGNVQYSGHAAVIVGYDVKRGFIVMNSYGPKWGDGGFGYLDAGTLRKCAYAGYGLLAGADWQGLRRSF